MAGVTPSKMHPLRAARLRAGFRSGREFAEAAGVSHVTVSSIERGSNTDLQDATLLKIAAALGLDPVQLDADIRAAAAPPADAETAAA